jgi:hypothetical protein
LPLFASGFIFKTGPLPFAKPFPQRPLVVVLLACLGCAKAETVRSSASGNTARAPREAISLLVGHGVRTCGAVPVAPRLAVTALYCVRRACGKPASAGANGCRLEFAVRNGRTGSAKLALASESDALALLELGQRVGTWVPVGCKDLGPDDTLYGLGPSLPAPPDSLRRQLDARTFLTGTETRAAGNDSGRLLERFAPPTSAPDLSVFIDSDRVRQLVAEYCSRHPSRRCQEAGCRSRVPGSRSGTRGVAAFDLRLPDDADG